MSSDRFQPSQATTQVEPPPRRPAASLRTVRLGIPMAHTEHLIRLQLQAGHSPDAVTGMVSEWLEAIRGTTTDPSKTEASSNEGAMLRAAIAVWVAHVDAARRPG
jgi:hypothetical protein